MRIAVVGRGRLATALGMAAHSAGHDVTLLRSPQAAAGEASPLAEDVLSADLDWAAFDLVLLAFEKKASSVAELTDDPALGQLRRIPESTPIASVVWTPPPPLLDAFLARHRIAHFLTTPAASLPGALALLPQTPPATEPLKAALPDLHWIEAGEAEYGRLAMLLIGSGIATAALGHLAQQLEGALTDAEAALLPHVLDDAKRLLWLNGGDPFRAFSSVATPGGFTERTHNTVFAAKWPVEP